MCRSDPKKIRGSPVENSGDITAGPVTAVTRRNVSPPSVDTDSSDGDVQKIRGSRG
jgi:hypothetical protein